MCIGIIRNNFLVCGRARAEVRIPATDASHYVARGSRLCLPLGHMGRSPVGITGIHIVESFLRSPVYPNATVDAPRDHLVTGGGELICPKTQLSLRFTTMVLSWGPVFNRPSNLVKWP